MLLSRHITIQTLIVWLIASLGVGVLGYHYLANFDWYDSLLNASMILGGMGPVGTLNSTSAKLFASCYALFSGVVFIAVMGVLIAPVFHRMLHKFHVEEKDVAGETEPAEPGDTE